MNPLWTAGLVVLGVALAAWLLRRSSGTEGIDRSVLSGAAPEETPAGDEPEATDEGAEDAEDGARQMAAITSDGVMFMPVAEGVELLLMGSPGEVEAHLARRAGGGAVAGLLAPGDLLGARVVRGAAGVDPWRLEALGREREYLSWSFETEEAARVALDMLDRAVVKAPPNAEGDPAPPTSADFDQALQVKEQTARELAMMPETEEPEEPR